MQNTTVSGIESKIYLIRGQKVLLDSDLAFLYDVETKVLNQAVRRNSDRFFEDFMFQLNVDEEEFLRSQFVTSKTGSSGRLREVLKSNRELMSERSAPLKRIIGLGKKDL